MKGRIFFKCCNLISKLDNFFIRVWLQDTIRDPTGTFKIRPHHEIQTWKLAGSFASAFVSAEVTEQVEVTAPSPAKLICQLWGDTQQR